MRIPGSLFSAKERAFTLVLQATTDDLALPNYGRLVFLQESGFCFLLLVVLQLRNTNRHSLCASFFCTCLWKATQSAIPTQSLVLHPKEIWCVPCLTSSCADRV